MAGYRTNFSNSVNQSLTARNVRRLVRAAVYRRRCPPHASCCLTHSMLRACRPARMNELQALPKRARNEALRFGPLMPRKKNLPFGFEEGKQHVTIVLKHRLRDKSASSLNRMARKVNFVCNDCNDAQKHAFETKSWKDKWLSAEALGSHGRLVEGIGPFVSRHPRRFASTTSSLANSITSAGFATADATASDGCPTIRCCLTARRSSSMVSAMSRCTCGRVCSTRLRHVREL
jgi:hypothetical protein